MTPARKKTAIEEVPAKQRRELQQLLAEKARLSRIMRESKEEVDAITGTLIPMLRVLGITNVLADDDQGMPREFVVTRGCSASRINREKLIQKAVDPAIIDECTEPGTEFFTVTVRAIKGED